MAIGGPDQARPRLAVRGLSAGPDPHEAHRDLLPSTAPPRRRRPIRLDHFFNINQTTQVRDNLRTRATLDWSPSRQDGMLPALDGATYPQGNFDIIDRRQNYTASASADWVANPQAVRRHARRLFHEQPHDRERRRSSRSLSSRGPTSGIWTCPRRFSSVGGFQTDLSNDVSRGRSAVARQRAGRRDVLRQPGRATHAQGRRAARSAGQRRGQGAERQPRQPASGTRALAGQRGRYGYLPCVQQPHRSQARPDHTRRRAATRPLACSCRTRGP